MLEDPMGRDLALGASGRLAELNRLEVLLAADVHVALRLGELAEETDEEVLLAVAMVVRAVRLGAVCLDLSTIPDLPLGEDVGFAWPQTRSWLARCDNSRLAAHGVLHLEGNLLYLDRHWREEQQIRDDLVARLDLRVEVDEPALAAASDRLFGDGWEEQRAATDAATRQSTTVLTGGPGTGKTASVARMLAVLAEQHLLATGREARMAMAAPTGKAATRMQESVAREREAMPVVDAARLDGVAASTLHRLLGWRPDNSTRFRHHRTNPLPYDVIVVDEVSMVSLSMTARLLEAVRPSTRLILVGDPDQLSSVEAGAVLADLVAGFAGREPSPVATLLTNHRTPDDVDGIALDTIAAALRTGDADSALAVLRSDENAHRLVDPDDVAALTAIRADVAGAADELAAAAAVGDAETALTLLERARLLCAHREGPYGVSGWNRQVTRHLADAAGVGYLDEWYAGRPVLITANDRGLRLSNGDLGITIRKPDGRLRVVVRSDGELREFAPTRLPAVETVYAMTVHKSQGSEAEEVTVILPPEDSPLLTRELFYTAVTRARGRLTVVGSEASVLAAAARRVQRASGLAQRLAASGG